jgi:serine/threonine protein kinase
VRSIGRYEVEAELGRGGMGRVFVVKDPAHGARRALKLLPADALDQAALQRFEVEARALARVRHPGVVAIHDVGRAPAGPFIVTDLIEGEPLIKLVERGPTPPREAARLVRELAMAVAACHAVGILHRDLKPHNAIRRPDGSVVLLDFGLARDEATTQRLTRTGEVLGTPAYMAPEQADGSTATDARADVYGLGATLLALLAGRAPFDDGGGMVAVLQRVMEEAPRWPVDAPRALLDLLRATMARRAEDRPPSAAAVAEALGRWLHDAPEAPASGRSILAAVAVTAFVAVAGTVAVMSMIGARRDPPVVVTPPPPTTPTTPPPPTTTPPPPTTTPPTWRERARGAKAPSPRCSHTLTYDPVRQVVLMFGGHDQRRCFSDLWAWDGETWQELTPEGEVPSPRFVHGAAFDRATGRLVIHGGTTMGRREATLGDVWAWDGKRWSKLDATGGPWTRAWHVLVEVPERGWLLSVGGRDVAADAKDPVWILEGERWRPAEQTGASPELVSHGAAWDARRGVLVAFGGLSGSDLVWEWDGARWTSVPTPRGQGPGSRTAVLVTAGEQVLLCGGKTGPTHHDDTWAWDGARWSPLADPQRPPGRGWQALAFDEHRGVLVSFGGFTGSYLGDTWERE